MLAKKIIATVACLSMVAMMAPGLSQAATAAELQTQIETLQSQLATLMGQLGGTTTTPTTTTTTTTGGTVPAVCAGVNFSVNLTIGSTGPDVMCLQALLNQNPTTQVAATGAGSPGNETSYFGTRTKAAVVVFQQNNAAEVLAPAGLTAGTGYVGALTRAKLNAMLAGGVTTGGGTTTTPSGLPQGCTSTTGYSPVTGEACSSTTTTTTPTTGGTEGAITVSLNPSPADSTKVYEGDSKIAVYALKIKATGSDMDVQRVTLEFNKLPYTYFSNIYIYDGSTELVAAPLNSSTVSKVDASHYQITLSGFTSKVLVPNNTTKILTVKVDVNGGISSGAWVTGTTATTITIANPNATSVRAVDTAGLNQYSGVTTARTISINASESTNATLTVSVDANTPKARNVIADSSQKISGATLLTFGMKAAKDTEIVDSIVNVTFTSSAGYADPTTVYLYDDSGSVIGTGTPDASHQVDFTDLNYTIAKDTTKTFTVRIDDTVDEGDATTGIGTDDGQKYKVTVTGSNVTFVKSNGLTGTGTGSAASYDAIAYAEGAVFTLSSITTTNYQASIANASSTLSATFNVQVQAISGDAWIPTASAFTIHYGKNNTDMGAITDTPTYVQPSGTTAGTSAYKVSEGTTATFAISATLANGGVAGTYDLRMSSIIWGHEDLAATAAEFSTSTPTVSGKVTSNYMDNDSNWISPATYLR